MGSFIRFSQQFPLWCFCGNIRYTCTYREASFFFEDSLRDRATWSSRPFYCETTIPSIKVIYFQFLICLIRPFGSREVEVSLKSCVLQTCQEVRGNIFTLHMWFRFQTTLHPQSTVFSKKKKKIDEYCTNVSRRQQKEDSVGLLLVKDMLLLIAIREQKHIIYVTRTLAVMCLVQ